MPALPPLDVPFFGNAVLCLIMVSAAYTFAMSVGAASGRPHLLRAARTGTYATCAFVFVAVAVLAYAFQTHDFRITYVARYSDRSMPWWYLITSLWGGQDGSLLWWSFLMAGYTAACTRWMRGRYLEMQPWVLAVLMALFLFFAILMLFPANPFATYINPTPPPDGEGLNPLLQNYWMAIHPPALYLGFVGWSVPFAIVMAALLSGRLGIEWIQMARPWAMIAWTFLSLGLLLGCLWSYEELGWGGYWAWDPVENASFMPWLVGTAYLHSALIQERRSMLKVWNVFLMCLTFFMTIFGTFLTRSGMIASVHAFAKSDIGIFFVWFMFLLATAITSLIIFRYKALSGKHRIESLLSREFAFLFNNVLLLGMMIAVLVMTMWPKITELLEGRESTMGPRIFNEWMTPLGLMLLFLAGLGPLIAWRKASGKNLQRALRAPTIMALVIGVAHVALGESIGRPALVETGGTVLQGTGAAIMAPFHMAAPLISSMVCAFVTTSILQEFWRGASVRMGKGEGPLTALYQLTARARRRYGGYLVHLGVVFMFVGFTGAAYDTTHEASVAPGGVVDAGDHQLTYEGPRREIDPNKQMIFTDLVLDGQQRVSPAKFIYRLRPEMPTTEVAIQSRPLEDVYVIMSRVDPTTRRATFQVKVRPLVWWIWFGGVLVLFGSLVAMWPKTSAQTRKRRKKSRSGGALRTAAGTAALVIFMAFALLPLMAGWASAQQDSSSLHAGSVVMHDHTEEELFGTLLCQCGDCPRLALDVCACGWAENKRAEIRERRAAGVTPERIVSSYRAQYGSGSISIPASEGLDLAVWITPLLAVALLAVSATYLGRKWRAAAAAAGSETDATRSGGYRDSADDHTEDDYDARLDAQLARILDEDAPADGGDDA